MCRFLVIRVFFVDVVVVVVVVGGCVAATGAVAVAVSADVTVTDHVQYNRSRYIIS